MVCYHDSRAVSSAAPKVRNRCTDKLFYLKRPEQLQERGERRIAGDARSNKIREVGMWKERKVEQRASSGRKRGY